MVRTIISLLACVAVGLIPLTAGADEDRDGMVFQYSVEFVCGSNPDDYASVVPGDYTMVANVHNANTVPNQARSKVSLTFPGRSSMSDPIMTEFAPQASEQLNCEDIYSRFAFIQPIGDVPLIQGFLLIQSRKPLVVVARYTATGMTGEVALDVERVRGELIDRPDEGSDDDKVEICHIPPGNPGNAKEIEVDVSSVPSHLDHGDNVGECKEEDKKKDTKKKKKKNSFWN